MCVDAPEKPEERNEEEHRRYNIHTLCVYDNWKEMTNAVAWIRCFFDCTLHYDDVPVFVLIFYTND